MAKSMIIPALIRVVFIIVGSEVRLVCTRGMSARRMTMTNSEALSIIDNAKQSAKKAVSKEDTAF